MLAAWELMFVLIKRIAMPKHFVTVRRVKTSILALTSNEGGDYRTVVEMLATGISTIPGVSRSTIEWRVPSRPRWPLRSAAALSLGGHGSASARHRTRQGGSRHLSQGEVYVGAVS